jgi:hypothetical protein
VSHQAAGSFRREDGTASVEMVAVVPFLLLAVLVAAQIGLAGQALPDSMRDGAEVSDGEGVFVRVVVPRLLPAMPELSVGAEAALEAGDG